jgi:uncharacterized iron-regulated protein
MMAVVLTVAFVSTGEASPDARLLDLSSRETLPLNDLLPSLARSRLILVGELHNQKAHHDAQLSTIRALTEAGVPVAVGFEMFEKESQPALDRWVSGDMDRPAFQRVYYENWNFPWELYEDIFEYARAKRIPMVGLNVPRDITRQVARQGFGSLSEEQRGRLPEVACRVDKKYMQFIRRAFGAHAHGNLNFSYFCEAQLVWDTAMAIHAIEFLEAHPQRTMILITGSGHARKLGIPDQFRRRSELPFTVILPEVPGVVDANTLSSEDADYLYLIP